MLNDQLHDSDMYHTHLAQMMITDSYFMPHRFIVKFWYVGDNYQILWIIQIISLHMYVPCTSAFLESLAGSKCFGNLFNWCTWMRAFKWWTPHATDPKICWDTSKVATNPTGIIDNIFGIKRSDQGQHAKSMNFLLCLKCWHCHVFVKGGVFYFAVRISHPDHI